MQERQTTATGFPNTMSILSLRTTGNVEAGPTCISNDRNIAGRYANGDLAELLIYNQPLNEAQITNVGGNIT